MNSKELDRIKRRFRDYINDFELRHGGLHPLLELKVEHSGRVARNCREIALGIGSDEGCVNCAEAIGLLHDIGRFRQFAEYRTLSDKDSMDHGEAGYELLRELGAISFLAQVEQESVLNAVRYHNRREIPSGLPIASLPYVRLVRDADKVDIFRIVIEEIKKDGFRHLEDIKAGVSRSFQPSAAAVAEVREMHSMSMETVTSIGDFLLLQMSWVYDLNYPPARRMLLDSGALDLMSAHIDGDATVDELIGQMRAHCEWER